VDLVEDERREQIHGADREVDLPVDHQEDLAGGEDRDRREVGQQRFEVAAGRELVCGDREVDDRQGRDDDDASFAQGQEALEQGPRGGAEGPNSARALLRRFGLGRLAAGLDSHG
jgi:hypothetical protein